MAFELGYIEFFLNAIPSKAQCTDTLNPRFSNGLLTYPTAAPDPNNKFGGTVNGGQGPCVINQNASQLATFQIPSYAELKRNYFEQISPSYLSSHNHIDKIINPNSSCPNIGLPTATDASISFNGNRDRLVNLTTAPASTTKCILTMVQSPVMHPETNMVVFLDGDLVVTGDLLYPNHALGTPPPQNAGIIYVVKGDILISSTVSELDGVFMAGGTIYTSCSGTVKATCLAADQTATTKQLVINGNLINLDKDQPIVFKRDLALVNGNTTPAEKVIADPKFLVLFHQLFAQTYSVQTEDTNFAIR
jgi:hypothetical protein